MLGRSTGAVLLGVEARLVDVEVDLGGGLPFIAAVGLPDEAVRQGIDRIRAALRNAGFEFPQHRIIVNLAPADIPKRGASLDLPIAAALLLASGQLPPFDPSSAVLVGELALDGALRPVRGSLSVALEARARGKRRVLLPRANAAEAALVRDLEIVPLGTLADLRAFAQTRRGGMSGIDAERMLRETQARESRPGADLADVHGQASGRRALEIAAAGGHHLLFVGPPGAGKTMLASRLSGILPPLALDEAIEVTRVWSAAGLCQGLVTTRPFRAPHHGISSAAMTGGGSRLRPGEVSLATNGVLYLDELTEFRRDVLESLRQPLEDGTIRVVRVREAATFPAAFMLVASMNPCPCGHRGSRDGRCGCTPLVVRRYLGKLSGPLLDRFDLLVEIPPLDLASLSRHADGQSSADVRRRVVAARARQRERHGGDGPPCNARLAGSALERFAPLAPAARRLLLSACERLGLSARGFDRVRRVARTLADLAEAEAIAPEHVAEAVQYRQAGVLARN